jgi:hypothetical protein
MHLNNHFIILCNKNNITFLVCFRVTLVLLCKHESVYLR